MIYNLTPDQFEATVLNIVYNLSQLANVRMTDEVVEKCKEELLSTGKINIIEDDNQIA